VLLHAHAPSPHRVPPALQIGGTELAPFVVWGGMGALAFGALKGLAAANDARLGRGRGPGRWVYDRSLGGKKVRAAVGLGVMGGSLRDSAVHSIRSCCWWTVSQAGATLG